MKHRAPPASFALICLITLLGLDGLLFCSPAQAWPGRVVYVFEGDIVHVQPLEGEHKIRIRLYGIDSPERDQAYGEEAHDFAGRLLLNQEVEVEEKDSDRYGRIVAVLHINGSTAQDRLLEAGLAWVYPRYCVTDECVGWELKEQEAQKERYGLWHDLDGQKPPLEPWKWRRGQR
ncbi:thermonuclease family protein [Desulfovibrio sp. OttesenSCG-928-G11]|nr:thermonuclease family protein [Desulfovibrio sp. OttesenSCG-928-G11]